MRPVGVAGEASQADYLAGAHPLADSHTGFLQMSIDRFIPLGMA